MICKFDKEAIILDFFSGSATTAHSIMQLNVEDGGNRKFIMVQLPEETAEKSEAYKAGYKNICEIGKERIRRAGEKIKSTNQKITITHEITPVGEEEVPLGDTGVVLQKTMFEEYKGETKLDIKKLYNKNLDTGFRVLKCDSSNMKDVYYNPAEYEPSLFSRLEDNIKEDRTPEDLLFQVMLDLGILLSSKIQVRSEKVGMRSYSYFDVEDGYLIACFDKNIDEEVITAMRPLVAMGVGLSLDLSEMEEVLRLGGMAFQDGDREQEAYKYLFTAFYGKGIDECNDFLEAVNVPTLGTQQRK